MKLLKKILFVFGIIGLLFISCSDDDDPASPFNESGLVGKWYFVDDVVNGVSIPYNDHEDCGKDYVELLANHEYRQIDVWDCEEDVDETGTWSLNDDQFSITTDGETSIFTITKLTDSSLELFIIGDYDDDGDDDEVTLRFSSS